MIAKNLTVGKPITFTYTNWRGTTSVRHVVILSVEYGTTPHHNAAQWFVRCFDIDKKAERTFALSDIHTHQ